MVPVNTQRGAGEIVPGRQRNAACGLFGLGLVLALFLTLYPTIVAVSESVLGVLAAAAIVWLFITSWLVLWLGMVMALARLWGRPTTTEPGR